MSVSDSYDVMASGKLNVHDNMPGYLTALEGRPIILPIREAYYPDPACLEWHRENVLHRN